MGWIAAFPQNLALIRLTVSEKTRFTDGRTMDARATALALLSQSSRAKKRPVKGRREGWGGELEPQMLCFIQWSLS